MTMNSKATMQHELGRVTTNPTLDVKRIGIVSRDYRVKFENGYRDFSYSLPGVLKLLDNNGCDTIIFSLYSIIPREGYKPHVTFSGLKNVKVILLEEFVDKEEGRENRRYVVYHRSSSCWEEYEFSQKFGTLSGMPQDFVRDEIPKRILGNCCILLCGETNGVKYSKSTKRIHDTFGVRNAIPENVKVVLNPIHDRMTRFEMKLKRQFLSENKRWAISVWNKGKENKNGKTRDGNRPAWTIFYDGIELGIQMIQNDFGVDIGILDINDA